MGGGGLEGKDTFQGVADAFFAETEGDGVFLAGGTAIEREAELIEEKFLENQALLGGRAELVERVDGFFGSGEMRSRESFDP